MNQSFFRNIVLVQAIENADAERQILSEDDRRYASRSAHELAQWAAAEKQVALSSELFLQARAEQILKKLIERHAGLARLVAGKSRLAGLGWGLPLLAFLCGGLLDRMGDTHRVDLLAAPLLLIILWNLVVYLLLLVQMVFPQLGRTPWDALKRGAVFALAASPQLPRATPVVLASALTKFNAEWLVLSGPLLSARASRIIHLSAASFSLGVIASLYLRGMLSQYVAGWESTFLNAAQLHAILSMLFMPVQQLFSMPGFSLAQVQALQLAPLQIPHTDTSGYGALWVHLYASTLLLLVIIPRTLLALLGYARERWLGKHFSLNLAQPYFQTLTAKIGPAQVPLLRIFPYGFTLDEGREKILRAVAHSLLGEQVNVMLRPSTGYGVQLHAASKLDVSDKGSAGLTIVLFNLSATPEPENHAEFLNSFLQAGPRPASDQLARVLVLVDQSAYLERLGAQAGAEQRLHERIALWRQFCATQQAACMVLNLRELQKSSDDIGRGWPGAAGLAA
ncbi:DUF2868 domain-containing protein [Undibacterium parvum]|uniref:DUF2868 domain-containing protein n=2 Tax=Undibacterium TaxID=401469 RepID=A0A6M4A2S1_9BURK|nr:DUF2868 domain-containing protein [Undibacterium parvum]AZP10809.1 DUF2868 domain-containing protein [Undibacterium parvum]QJQ05403.1 DUF2868 domain-containing protein [Undibacterium piscinae]